MNARKKFISLLWFTLFACGTIHAGMIGRDSIQGAQGPVIFEMYGHSSFSILYKGHRLYVDPVEKFMGKGEFPMASAVLVTHEHFDHLDSAKIQSLLGSDGRLVVNAAVRAILGKGEVLEYGKSLRVGNISVEAVPAYNITPGHEIYHPKGRDNGYVVTVGTKRIYIAGDTEDIQDLQLLKNIDVAFLPVNQPYTMTIPQFIHAAKMINAKVTYPYHLGNTNLDQLKAECEKEKDLQIRVLDWK